MCWKHLVVSCVAPLCVIVSLTAHAQDKPDAEKADPLKLTIEEQRFVSQLEKLLITKLSGRGNPSDQYTYYVLMFIDQAQATTTRSAGSASRRIGSRTTRVPLTKTTVDTMTARGAVMVRGRREAALTVAKYLSSQNAAANALAETKRKNATDGARDWDYRAFFVEEDAKAFYESVKPKETAKDK